MRFDSLHDDIADHGLVACLWAMGFATGLVDSFSIASYQCFTANQTGNSILIYVGAFSLIEHIRFLNICVSLSTFLVSCMVGGQLGNIFGRKRRWWMLLSHSFQTFSIVLTGILHATGVISKEASSRFTAIVLLSIALGLQVALARSSGIPEVPTAMLTTPYGDLLVDPELFKLGRSRSRDRRLVYIACIWSGGAVGAAMYRYTNEESPIYLAGAIKFIVTVAIIFLPSNGNPSASKARLEGGDGSGSSDGSSASHLQMQSGDNRIC